MRLGLALADRLGALLCLLIASMGWATRCHVVGPKVLRAIFFAGRNAAAALVLGSIFIVCDGLNDKIERADVALVLGSKVDPDGQPSKGLKARLDRVLEIFQSGLVSSIIVSGGTGQEGFDEAKVMAAYLVNRGVPAGKIIEDPRGANTKASAIDTARIMDERGWRSVLVVSQYFHLSRAKLALGRVGVEEIFSAHAYLYDWRDLYSIPREVVGYVSYSSRKFDEPNQ